MWSIEKSFHPLSISKVFEEIMHIYIQSLDPLHQKCNLLPEQKLISSAS